ncbi:unnamed protein product, partial [Polarella glacialis]
GAAFLRLALPAAETPLQGLEATSLHEALESLDCHGCLALTAAALTPLASAAQWPRLRQVNLTDCALVVDSVLLLVVRAAWQLEELDCRGCPLVTRRGVRMAASSAGPALNAIHTDLLGPLVHAWPPWRAEPWALAAWLCNPKLRHRWCKLRGVEEVAEAQRSMVMGLAALLVVVVAAALPSRGP